MIDEARVGVALDPELQSCTIEEAYDKRRVTDLIRRAVASGLSETAPVPTMSSACLGPVVTTGAFVLLKPNWVTHRNEGGFGTAELYTHRAFVLAALDEVLRTRPARVVIGDAPIQSCKWDEIVTPGFREELVALGRSAGVPIEIIDFRRTRLQRGVFSSSLVSDARDRDRYVEFDLGVDSLLEPLTAEANFRVAAYDHRALAKTHRPGVHRYLLCREAFEADVVISLPKLKTHCKAGMTGALKNLVGLNGNKDYLPHHRVGGSASGGDGYPGSSSAKRLAEHMEDLANERLGKLGYGPLHLLERVLRRVAGGGSTMGGAWSGNDTCWRMALDLNRVLLYGDAHGTMHDAPQRTYYSLTDAIVCGEGDGPLRPEPCRVGAVTFSPSAGAADHVHAHLLGLDPQKIALVRESLAARRWSLAPERWAAYSDGQLVSLPQISRMSGVSARAPAGWRGRIELAQTA